MESQDANGPDATSIKPVSSLRARFENFNKSDEALPKPSSRPISPGPKPEKLRDFKPGQQTASVSPSVPTTAAAPSAGVRNGDAQPPPVPAPGTRPPPSAQFKPPEALNPPSLTVQPPQSPPKKPVATFSVATNQTSFLNPEVIASPATPNNSKQFKIPSRPHTPTPSLPAPRSPRLGTSNPPSPPPPRRSGEIRRDKEPRHASVPPINRAEKPTIPASKPAFIANSLSGPIPRKADISTETSPFNSPPGSPDAGDQDVALPPELPSRPRPQAQNDKTSQSRAALGGFQPPPVHQAITARRGRQEAAELGTREQLKPHLTGEARPALPARPRRMETSPDIGTMTNSTKAPSRPPKPGPPDPPPARDTDRTNQTKRVPPTAAPQQFLPPPSKAHARPRTMDRDPEPRESVRSAQPAVTSKTTTSTTMPQAMPGKAEGSSQVVTYPDGTNVNRRPPFMKKGCYEIPTKFDPRLFDVCGEYVCASGSLTRVWSVLDGELLMSLAHTEGIKATSVAFYPALDPKEEGKRLWIGTTSGDIMEVDVLTHSITTSKPNVHGRLEVTNIYRHYNELWTLDESGMLHVWGPGDDGLPKITGNPTQTYKLPRNHTFSIVIGDELWHATGKEVRVFVPTLDGKSQFQVLLRPLIADGAGEVTSGTLVKSQPGKVFFGHADGKVSVYSTADYASLGVVNVSNWKINALSGVGPHLWAAFNLGKICVYDISQKPWCVLKEWQAHDNPVVKMKVDLSSAYEFDKLHVVSLGADNKIRIWDGLLQDDWLERELRAREKTYCQFDEIRTLVMTWNAGASTPHSLRYSGNDATFFQNLLATSDAPDILVFGFQELVDLEDKTATAKRLFKAKKKEGSDQERMSHQYRDWRDFLLKSLDDHMPGNELYHLLHSAPLVGLFTCIFVKASLRDRIRNLSSAEVKRGMGGLHGNKGAIAIRFQIDDSSLCFINCHLAAGQAQAHARHNDVAAILETSIFPPERDLELRLDNYIGGGDGTMIVDHELCIMNGDLNYRIDTMSRDTVVAAVKQRNLAKLLDRDQLLVARRRNPAFRLRTFEEMPITFAPTYKYDVGTDNYDTSEKRRSPAWCDRLLYKGRDRIQQLDYERHEVHVSDHRPVSGCFRLWVKKIDPRGRATAWMECQRGFEDVRQREIEEAKLRYLSTVCGFDEKTSKALTTERVSRRDRRSPTRN